MILSVLCLATLVGASAPVADRLARGLENVDLAIVLTSAALGVRLQQVSVSGRTQTPTEDILEALGIRRGDPLLDLHPDAARDRLQRLPWVKSARVERLLPSEVRVSLVERTPIALWQSRSGTFHLIDADGMVLGAASDPFLSLPVVVGRGAPRATSDLLALLTAYPALTKRVYAAVRFGQRRWDLWLDGYGGNHSDIPPHDAAAASTATLTPPSPDLTSRPGIQVRLPEDTPEKALTRLAHLEQQSAILERDISMIDLRQDDRLGIRRRSPPEESVPMPSTPTPPHALPEIPLQGPAQDA